MKTTHTHRGTCQACGRIHAVDNTSRLVAKHGYTVDFGYFHGVCQGGRSEKPAEFDVSLTHKTIVACEKIAKYHDDFAFGLRTGTVIPETFDRWNPTKIVDKRNAWGRTYKGKGGYDTLSIDQATPEELERAKNNAIHMHESNARGLRAHAKGLVEQVLPRLGQELYPVTEEKFTLTPDPVVDIKNATVIGEFKTKAARKNALDKLNREYRQEIDKLQNIFLAIPSHRRTSAQSDVYYSPHDLHQWRDRHSKAAVAVFPESAEIVANIEALVKAREAVKGCSVS